MSDYNRPVQETESFKRLRSEILAAQKSPIERALERIKWMRDEYRRQVAQYERAEREEPDEDVRRLRHEDTRYQKAILSGYEHSAEIIRECMEREPK